VTDTLTPLRASVRWQTGTVVEVVQETYRTKTFRIRLPRWQTFRAGQHFRIRLTAPDGYQAQRNYSIASAPETEGEIALTIELIPGGEVSSYFHETVRPGDEIELRGPIGGPFTWVSDMGGPLFLVAAGSGIVPLMSMIRHRANCAPDIEATLLYSSRTQEDIIYRHELETRGASGEVLTVIHTLTRSVPPGWTGKSGRLNRDAISKALSRHRAVPRFYVCGPTAFVEMAASALVDLGVPLERIRTERFGPSD
jgi:ferredoxin-NADP reductase